MRIDALPEIDWDTFPESDGEPMAETQANATQMMDLIFTLGTLFQNQGRGDSTAVGGNQLMYFNPSNGRDHISPDVYVIFDYPPPPPPSWRTWEEGRFPDIVFEITSPSTQDTDVSALAGAGKRWRYEDLGVREYYIYDPQGTLNPPLQGYARWGEGLERMVPLTNGALYSPLLGAELRPVGVYLRVVDPATGLVLLTADETRAQLNATQALLSVAEERAADEMRSRLAAQERAVVAEQRVSSMEEALRLALARLGEQMPPT